MSFIIFPSLLQRLKTLCSNCLDKDKATEHLELGINPLQQAIRPAPPTWFNFNCSTSNSRLFLEGYSFILRCNSSTTATFILQAAYATVCGSVALLSSFASRNNHKSRSTVRVFNKDFMRSFHVGIL